MKHGNIERQDNCGRYIINRSNINIAVWKLDTSLVFVVGAGFRVMKKINNC